MKKIFTSMLVSLMMLLSGIVPLLAISYDKSYNAAKNYYALKTELNSADEVIAYESLGLQSDSLPIKDVVKTDYASEIAKTVIALTLHGNDPRNYKNVNYVEMLEKYVHENGAFDKNKNSTYANFQIYGVYALYVVNSPKATLAADYLASLIDTNGAFGSSYGPSLDITSWSIEALSLVSKTRYQSTIQKAIDNLQSTRDGNAGYKDSWMGVNVNTQACVLMGLIAYDQAGVKGTTYNQGTNNPYDVLLKYQNSDGSFWYDVEGEDNYYASLQGVQAVGYYKNGSVYTRAKKEYQVIIKPAESEKEPPKKEEPKKEEIKKEPTDKKGDIVKTNDVTTMSLYILLMLVSGFVVVKGKKNIG